MANRPALPTSEGGEVYVTSKTSDSFSFLDVLHANQFKGEFVEPQHAEQVEENFYRGAPPNWLNFYISEQAVSDGTATPFIKRDGYETLKDQIHLRRKGPGTSTIKLFHQQGCGGTTLAMQVLWDLRKTFRCAVLTGSTLDITKVAQDVVSLFTAGSHGHQKTVLLLLNDEFILEILQDRIMEEIAEQDIDIDVPVVILLNCVRSSDGIIHQKERSYELRQKFKRKMRKSIILKKSLSAREQADFDMKKEELSRRFGDRCKQFHGFNILQSNFSEGYIRNACATFEHIKRTNKPLKTQLAAFLCLLNAYAPGSYILESQCLDFLRHEDEDDFTLEDQMQPFSHMIITFQQDGRSEKKVCMAHNMIAQYCTELLANAGVTRSDTTRNFLNSFCRSYVPPYLLGFIKDMLTKREMIIEDPTDGIKEKKEKFSRLIQDITKRDDDKKEGKHQSLSVLKVASKKFDDNPLFPQTLARFYYIELEDYNEAEIWAKKAKQRAPWSSYVADTLGQVHKNHLKNLKVSAKPREILQLAQKGMEAFEDEERLAENEHMKGKQGDGNIKVLRALNTRGQFCYLEVCSLLYDHLIRHDELWKQVLTKTVSLDSVRKSLRDEKLFRFKELVNSLRDMVEKRFEFFDNFLTYSYSVVKKEDPAYISRKTIECYKKYVGDAEPNDQLQKAFHKLKQKLAVTSPGVLSCLERCTRSDTKDIAVQWKEICQHKYSTRHALLNYILANIMLINMKETPSSSDYQSSFTEKMPLAPEMQPEFHMLALLLCWPTDGEDNLASDLHHLIKNILQSYEQEYKSLFQSRYLRPLFFLGPGQGLNRFVHRRNLEILWTQDALKASNTNWRNDDIFRDPTVQGKLLRVKGVVRNYRLYAIFGGTEIKLDVNRKDSLWKSGHVFFYLGFTISGPVAYSVHRRTEEEPSERLLEAFGNEMDSSQWTKQKPEVQIKDKVHTYSLQSESGNYECSESALRWVCKETVSFRYQFSSWERFMRKPVCMDYIPAGPLMDIKVTDGKLEEVHLPHWICTGENAAMSDIFRVLHVDSSGDYLEQVSEMTSSHVKLNQPDFSLRGAMILKKLGLYLKVFADVLIYTRITSGLTLHVYLVPHDPLIQQEVEKKEKSDGFRKIRKTSPIDPVQLESYFYLSTDWDTAEICPEKQQFMLERSDTNFFEVVIENVKSDFGNLKLKLEVEHRGGKEKDTVWMCTIGTAFHGSPLDSSDGQ
ncbi:sterile alpha motif domain-containing protein 9-like isoform X1 [Oreochromis niloticus]|uniref:sterile alpha motif domain-containing protein 9-like isoform X1 n=2 Tax=Oreochromis niloticus TaxID=8128 RepID=UPI000905530F|nr:sterile alpha motif domain-containing protein 9-like isoform X1 [Oreochromis niloticus]